MSTETDGSHEWRTGVITVLVDKHEGQSGSTPPTTWSTSPTARCITDPVSGCQRFTTIQEKNCRLVACFSVTH